MSRVHSAAGRALIAALALTAVTGGAFAQSATFFRDTFDTYADDVALGAVWLGGPTTDLPNEGLDTSRFTSSPKSYAHPGGNPVVPRRYHKFAAPGQELTPDDTDPIVIKFRIYNQPNTGKRATVSLRVGNAGTWPANDAWIELGMYNSLDTSKFQLRTVYLGGPNWANIESNGRNNSTPGWHEIRAELRATDLRVTVDGGPVSTHTWTGAAGKLFNFVAIGTPSEVTSPDGIWVDDLQISRLSDENAACIAVPPTAPANVLYNGSTTVKLSNVDASATSVKVYDRTVSTVNPIGTADAPFTYDGPNVVVTTTPLVSGNLIVATQVVGGTEGCMPTLGVTVDSCEQVARPTVSGLLVAGLTSVNVTGVDPSATSVKVYAKDAFDVVRLIGTNNAPGGNTTVAVTVDPLVDQETLLPTQTVDTVESCVGTTGPKIGDCAQIAAPYLGMADAGRTVVYVSNIDPSASAATVYVAGTPYSVNPGGNAKVGITVPALVAGQTVAATQTIMVGSVPLESCVSATQRLVTAAGVIEDFEQTNSTATNPSPGTPRVWYQVWNQTYGTVTFPTPALPWTSRILNTADSGYTNGIYAIYEGVIPASGEYHLELQMLINENSNLNAFPDYFVGVQVNGTHRTAPGELQAVPTSASGKYWGLTAAKDGFGVDPAPQDVYTSAFTANAGDSVLIAFSTDLTDWYTNNAFGDTAMMIDNIRLVAGPPPVTCRDVDAVSVTTTPSVTLEAGKTQVNVSGISTNPQATKVRVYSGELVGGSWVETKIGEVTPPIGVTGLTVDVTPLIAGRKITATQEYLVNSTLQEGCIPTQGAVVGTGKNSPIRLSLVIRETGNPNNLPIGADGGTVGSLEFLGATSLVGSAPQGKDLVVGPGWSEIVFYPATDPVQRLSASSGSNGVLDGTWGVLDGLAFATMGTNTGRYQINIDNVRQGIAPDPVAMIADFESIAVGDTTSMFIVAPDSGNVSFPNIAAAPKANIVEAVGADGSSRSESLVWQFVDNSLTRWVWASARDAAEPRALDVPNPLVDFSKPIVITYRLSGLPDCGEVFADRDADSDVDMDDFARLQACITINGSAPDEPMLPGCECFDRNVDGKIDMDDIVEFERCATGAGVDFQAANYPACTP